MAAVTTVWSQAGRDTLDYFVLCDQKRNEHAQGLIDEIKRLQHVNEDLKVQDAELTTENNRLLQINVDLEATKEVFEKKAREYQTELNNEIKRLEQQLESCRVQLFKHTNTLTTAQQEVKSLLSTNEKLEEKVVGLKVDYANVYEQYHTLKEEKDKLEQDIRTLKFSFEELQQKETFTANAFEDVSRQVGLIENEKVKLQDLYDKLIQANAELEIQLKKIKVLMSIKDQQLRDAHNVQKKLQDDIEQLRQDRTKLHMTQDRMEKLEADASRLSQENDKIQKTIHELQGENTRLVEEARRAADEIHRLRDESATLQQELKSREALNHQCMTAKQEADEMVKALQGNKLILEQYRDSLTADNEKLVKESKQLQQELRSKTNLQQEVQSLQSDNQNLVEKMTSLERDYEELRADMEGLYQENQGIASEKDRCEALNRDLNDKLNVLHRDNVALDNKVRNMPNYEDLRRDMARLQMENETLKRDIENCKAEIHRQQGISKSASHEECEKKLHEQLERLRQKAREILKKFDNVFKRIERSLLDDTLKQQFLANYRGASNDIELLR